MKSPVSNRMAASVIDALTSQICVVDKDGVIIVVNRAWKQFNVENTCGPAVDHIGVNYLNLCSHAVGPAAEEAVEFMGGLRAVLGGQREFFQIEYPCHSPKEMRWYLARISPLRLTTRSKKTVIKGAVVSHANITDRKLIEIDYARLAATDPLTSLPNRRFFDELCQLDLNRFLRFGGVSSLLMIDLDHFKSINDTHGHAAGDEVLRRVSELGKSVIRTGDLLARWGGEEFVCLLPGTDEAGATIIAEKLRSAVEVSEIVVAGKTIQVTASVGVSTFDKEDQNVDRVLLRADKALYRAKREGRNRVSCERQGVYLS